MDKNREQSILRIKRTRLYSGGERFTSRDLANRLNGRKKGCSLVTTEQIQKLCTVMQDRGLLTVHFTNNPKGGRDARWSRSKGASNWLAIPWRKHTDYQLGIRP